MLFLRINIIGESSNDESFNNHISSNVGSDNESNVPNGDFTTTGGVATSGSIICPNIEEEEVESPLPIPLQNVIDLDLEAIVVHVLVLHPIIHPSTLPPSKPKTTTKEYPPLTLIGYSWVYGKVVSYANSLCSYESIIEFLEGVKFCHVDCSDAMIIKSCLANVCILFELDNPFIFEF